MILVRRFLPIALSALCLAGCLDSAGPDATGPSLTPGAEVAADRKDEPNLKVLASFRGPAHRSETMVRKWIGREGGRLELDGFAIEVPQGAVKRGRVFTIRLPAHRKDAKRVVADFGPHGASFARPVVIELPYAGTSIEGQEGTPTIVWWNEDARAWVDVGGTLTADGQRVRTETSHFSLFGLTLRRSGGVTVSGG